MAPGVLEACGSCLSQRRNVLVTGITESVTFCYTLLTL